MADTSVSYRCPNCDAPLSFSPGQGKVTCDYCDTDFEVGTIEELFRKKEELAAKAADARDAKWETDGAGEEWTEAEAAALHSFACSSCGAELVTDENTMATECCYCGNPTMIPQRFSGMLKPDMVIPFKKTKEEAVAALKDFYRGKTLLPDAFTKGNRVEAIQPMYVPFWLFDSEVDASALFRAERVNIINLPDEVITETSVFDCERSAKMRFERIPVDGSKKMDNDYMESIEPFDYSELVPFSPAYFTGCLADKYDEDAASSAPRADRRVEASAIEVLEDTVTGFDNCTRQSVAVVKDGGKVTYAMAPVWILTTRYEDKPYTFMMNGQTGKVVGSLPYDKKKAMMYPGAVAAVLMVASYFAAKLFM